MFRRAAILALALSAPPLAAAADGFPVTPVQRALTFADCAGRYSAEVEHSYLLHPDRASLTEARRDWFLDLLDAVAPDALADGMPAAALLSARIEAKAAQAALLMRADFHVEPLASDSARRAAEARLDACAGWLLGV